MWHIGSFTKKQYHAVLRGVMQQYLPIQKPDNRPHNSSHINTQHLFHCPVQLLQARLINCIQNVTSRDHWSRFYTDKMPFLLPSNSITYVFIIVFDTVGWASGRASGQ